MPFISIIMPVYNNETLLPNAVNSIIDQTFSDWELIIIDDGSTDNTPQTADDFMNKDSRIKVIHQDNQWIFRSYNNGYAAASGKYAFIVNSDDTINPESLQRIHDAAIIDDADIVMFNLTMNLCDKFQNIIEPDLYDMASLLKNDFSYYGSEKVHKKWAEFLKLKLVSRQCVYKRNIYSNFKYNSDYYADDILYNIRIADKINAAAGTSYAVYNYNAYHDADNMNASYGKYYGYEHKMFNEMYIQYRDLFDKWGVLNSETQDLLSAIRLNNLTVEIRSYLSTQCKLTTEDKVMRIFDGASDMVIYDCAEKTGRVEELQSRVLSGMRELLLKEAISEKSEYYFIYELLNSLLCYEKDEDDLRKIKEAVYHKKNPKHIGECFYKKL